MSENKKLEFRGGSFMALIPFAIFIVITIGLSFANAADLNMMIGAGVVGLLVGMLFVKDLEAYWDTILAGLGSKVGMTAVMLWLVVGIYGNILKSGHIVEGLVWLGVQLNMSGAAFTVAAFVFAALFAMATGSGFGTISTMSFILYPAGILLGSNPAVLAGAILSGAAVGDNLAPVSDTTIIAATSQEYNNKEGTADIGGTVRTRSPLVIVGFVVAAVLFFIFGGSGGATLDPNHAAELLAAYQMPAGLLLLIPTALVIYLAVRGKNIFACLGIGSVVAIVIGLVAGLFDFSAIVAIEDGALVGAIPSGVAGMTTVSILLILVVSMGELLTRSGCMEATVNWLNSSVIKSPPRRGTGYFLAVYHLRHSDCRHQHDRQHLRGSVRQCDWPQEQSPPLSQRKHPRNDDLLVPVLCPLRRLCPAAARRSFLYEGCVSVPARAGCYGYVLYRFLSLGYLGRYAGCMYYRLGPSV